MKLYDTKSRQLKEVTATDGLLTMYCCGPTVYRDAHVGNLRTFMLADLILRVAALDGVKTKLVQNITDVGHMSEDFTGDDKILAQATIERKSPLEIARKYEEMFHDDLAQLNINKAHAYPRASESIDLMQSMIGELIEREFAYIGGDKTVYFDAQKFDSYGSISGNKLESLIPGHKFENHNDGAKRFHADWALWKTAGDRSEMIWDSPWGPGFPGWHIECSAMSLHFLNSHINLHVGGIDLRFPHHENERAQSNSITGVESVDLWVHGEHLLFEGRKMSKSAGNVVLLDDVITKGFDPLSLRLCFLENRYRSQMDLSWQSISAAHETIKRWRSKVAGWGVVKNITMDPAVLAYLENDLDTPRVITYLRALEKDAGASEDQKANAFAYADQVLGLDLTRAPEREAARSAKNWALSDELRATLESAGLEISDSASGQSWSWR